MARTGSRATAVRFAMPEVGIGFFPDVGATWFLPRLPGEAGTWCALTGERIDAADATALGPRHPSGRVGAVAGPARRAVRRGAGRCAAGRLRRAGRTAGPLQFTAMPSTGCSRPTGSRTSCRRSTRPAWRRAPDADFARRAAATIRTKSPTSLKIALAQLRRGKSLDFEACLRTEFRIVSRVVTGHDFYEGIRAVIVDKDHSPALAAADARRRQRRRRGAAISRRSPPSSICHDRSDHDRTAQDRSTRFMPARRRGGSTAGRRGWSCSCA